MHPCRLVPRCASLPGHSGMPTLPRISLVQRLFCDREPQVPCPALPCCDRHHEPQAPHRPSSRTSLCCDRCQYLRYAAPRSSQPPLAWPRARLAAAKGIRLVYVRSSTLLPRGARRAPMDTDVCPCQLVTRHSTCTVLPLHGRGTCASL